MKAKILSALLVTVFVLSSSISFGQSSQPSYEWTKKFGSTLPDSGHGVATDSVGNIYITGHFQGTVDFGLDFGETEAKTSAGQDDIFITKINANGSYGWTRRIGGASADFSEDIATDLLNNIYVAGYFAGTADFGLDFETADSKTSAGQDDIFVTKINANGTYGWTRRIGGIDFDRGWGMVTDSSGNIYVTGDFKGTVDFGLDFGAADSKTSAGQDDIFVTKINANGTYGWTRRIGGVDFDGGWGIVTDSSGNIYVTGYFQGTVDFGLDFGTTDPKPLAFQDDIFITKINTNGTYGWTRRIGGPSDDVGLGITADSSGNIYITGYFQDTVDFGADFATADSKTSAGYWDIFVTKINAIGTYGWTRRIGGASFDFCGGIAADLSGNIFISGGFEGTLDSGLDFGITDTKTSAGGDDALFARINADGTYGWTRRVGGALNDVSGEITTDSSGNIYVTGDFRGSGGSGVDFGLDFGTTDIKSGDGYEDGFLVRLSRARGYLVLDGYGGVHAGGGAVVFSPATAYFGWDIARDIALSPFYNGYYVLDGWGGVHNSGAAPALTPATPYFGWDIARDIELTADGRGYYVLDGYGGIHAGGVAASLSPPPPYFGWDIAQDLEVAAVSAGCYVLDGWGGVHAGGGAPSLSPGTPYFGWDIARDLELNPAESGYHVLDGFGGIHQGGDASPLTPATPYFGWDIAKNIEITASGTGCFVLDGYGGIHVGGSAVSLTPTTPYFGWDIARSLVIVK